MQSSIGGIISANVFIILLAYSLFFWLTHKTSFSKGLKAAIGIFILIGTFTFPVIFFVLMRSSETMTVSVPVFTVTNFLLGCIANLGIIVFLWDIVLLIWFAIKFVRMGISLLLKKRITRKRKEISEKIRFCTRRSVVIMIIAFITFIIGYIQAVGQPDFKSRNVVIGDGPAACKSIRIAHLSDLHMNPLINEGWLEKIIFKVNKAKPDLVVITGDFCDGKARNNKQFIPLLRRFNAPVYFISGNHEVIWGVDAWLKAFREAGIPVLDGLKATINIRGVKVLLAGIGDSGGGAWTFSPPVYFDGFLKGESAADIRILLSHRPEVLPYAAREGFDLVLAGHTHNGQTFPLNIIAELFTPFPCGFYKDGKTLLFTSPGAGYVGPPLRLFVSKEVTMLDITLSGRRSDPVKSGN